jgi:hypothetical protein
MKREGKHFIFDVVFDLTGQRLLLRQSEAVNILWQEQALRPK